MGLGRHQESIAPSSNRAGFDANEAFASKAATPLLRHPDTLNVLNVLDIRLTNDHAAGQIKARPCASRIPTPRAGDICRLGGVFYFSGAS